MRTLYLLALIVGLSSCGGAQKTQSPQGEAAKWKDATKAAKAERFYCMAPVNYSYAHIDLIGDKNPDPMPWAVNVGYAAKFLAYSKIFDDCVKSQPPEGITDELKKEIARNAADRTVALTALNENLAKLR